MPALHHMRPSHTIKHPWTVVSQLIIRILSLSPIRPHLVPPKLLDAVGLVVVEW